MKTETSQVKWIGKAWVIAAIAMVYLSTFAPSDWVRDAAIGATGNQPYEGVWIFIPHLLFYTTFSAILAGACWFGLTRAGHLPRPPFAISKSVLTWAAMGGVVSIAATLGFLHFVDMGGPKWVGLDGWKIAGNAFSNAYEELIYRGFLLAGLTVLIGFWPAAIVSSIVFGLTHDQYPLSLQVLIMGVSVGWCWLVRRTKSLWAAWGAHMLVDIVVDAVWG